MDSIYRPGYEFGVSQKELEETLTKDAIEEEKVEEVEHVETDIEKYMDWYDDKPFKRPDNLMEPNVLGWTILSRADMMRKEAQLRAKEISEMRLEPRVTLWCLSEIMEARDLWKKDPPIRMCIPFALLERHVAKKWGKYKIFNGKLDICDFVNPLLYGLIEQERINDGIHSYWAIVQVNFRKCELLLKLPF